MATRKTVAHMDEAEREYKRWNDRVNQQYSRARKKRKFEELQAQNKKLAAELETTKAELESFRRRESAVRSALDWVSAIVNDSSSSLSSSSKSREKAKTTPEAIPSPVRAQAVAPSTSPTVPPSHQGPNFGTSIHFEAPSVQDAVFDTQSLVAPPQQTASLGDFSSTFNSIDGNMVLNLPNEFGDGAWVNLLSTDMWSTNTSTNLFNPNIDPPITPDESPSNHSSSEEHSDGDGISAHGSGLSSKPVWQELPLNVGATNDLDTVLLEVTALGRQWKTRQGDYHSELSHPSFPSISSLLNRDVENDRSNNPLAAALAKYTVTTPVLNFPRKVAFHYTVALLLRWLVNPTEHSFSQLPEFLHPTIVQKTVPHPAWIDTVPWPQARDRIILNLDIFDYELFKRVTQLSSINWPGAERDLFIAKPGSKQMILNPRFVRHILNLNNWTNGPDLAKAFPFLSGWPTSPPVGPYQWPS